MSRINATLRPLALTLLLGLTACLTLPPPGEKPMTSVPAPGHTATPQDPYNLQRFVLAQEGVYPQVLTELKAGQKTSHWIWYIFPQVLGLGSSDYSITYAIHSRGEALAYLSHPLLGARLRECAELLLKITSRSANQILGSPDDLKVRSSMTLFESFSPGEQIFTAVLQKLYAGQRDQRTLDILTRWGKE